VKTLVIATRVGDELLGCGGTLLRRKAEGVELGWLIVTAISEDATRPAGKIRERDTQIGKVAALVGFSNAFNLKLPEGRLDSVANLDEQISKVFAAFKPEEVLLPPRSAVSGDHRAVFEAGLKCTKWFRRESIARVMSYEIPSCIGYGPITANAFEPGCFINIEKFVERKIEALAEYRTEKPAVPAEQRDRIVRALAMVRGSTAGFSAAEAFELVFARR
jgi:LmbE family N-acetylglucosaminyl deacetylase